MDADWEVEIGAGAQVIEADWQGFIDLRTHPECVHEIAEAAAFPPLADLLLVLNAANSPLWTSKCDLWEPEPSALASYPAELASYIDLLPIEGRVFAHWQQAEAFCREYVARLAPIALPECGEEPSRHSSPECTIALVIRQALAGDTEGFAITAYLSARSDSQTGAATALAAAMAVFADALPAAAPPATVGSRLQ